MCLSLGFTVIVEYKLKQSPKAQLFWKLTFERILLRINVWRVVWAEEFVYIHKLGKCFFQSSDLWPIFYYLFICAIPKELENIIENSRKIGLLCEISSKNIETGVVFSRHWCILFQWWSRWRWPLNFGRWLTIDRAGSRMMKTVGVNDWRKVALRWWRQESMVYRWTVL